MTLKCPNCNGFLEYDTATGRLLCPYCSSSFDVRDFDRVDAVGADNTYHESGNAQNRENNTPDADEDLMDTEIYTCTSCGAELMINNVESATFCAYCGQPTIVFSRISKMKKPKYIIPFTISKEQAHNIIRSKFRSGKYIPESVKNFTPEVIRGIYVPFMLYDVKYYDRQLIRSTHKQGKSSTTYYHYREATNRFANITVDSSFNFNDESSQRLEPYDLSNMQPFQAPYLSGYYADCMDDDSAKLENTAIERSKFLFDQAVLKTVSGSNKVIIENNPSVQITNSDYVMLPVWFVVFHDKDAHYTVMVNGQTGKMVGAVPCDTRLVKTNLSIYCTICSCICVFLLSFLYKGATISEAASNVTAIILVIIAMMVVYIKNAYSAYKKSQSLTSACQIKHLASDRQEGD